MCKGRLSGGPVEALDACEPAAGELDVFLFALNELYQDINAAGTAAVTTTFAYDGNGNAISGAAPLSRTTASAYDELNRLRQITDPANSVTRLSYNADDRLTSVVDPRSLTTTYAYNGFGELI